MQSGSRNLKSLGLISVMLLCLMPFQNCGQGFKSTTLEKESVVEEDRSGLSPEQLSIDPYYGEDAGPQSWTNLKPTLDVGVTAGVTPLSQLAFTSQGLYAAALSGPQIAFYRSLDKGDTWSLPNGQLRSAGTNRAFRFLKLFGTKQSRIYMSTFSTRSTNPTIDRQFDLEFSEDGGNLWSRIQLETGPQGQVVAPCVYLNGDSRNLQLVPKDSVREISAQYISSEARCGKVFARGTRIVYSYVLRQTKQNNDVVITSHLRVSNNSGQDWQTVDLSQLLGGQPAYSTWRIFRDRFGTMVATSFIESSSSAGIMKVSSDLGQSWGTVEINTNTQAINSSTNVTSDYMGNLFVTTSLDPGANQPVTRKSCRVQVPDVVTPGSPLTCASFLPPNSEDDHGFAQDLMAVGKRIFWIGLTGNNNSRTEFTIRRFY
ncbi:MAG: hypothetical protein K2X47_05455 [Bdellovibrionales bacterium]|nr:hypothetical protein [Bdellovibrionales bacterium]